MLNDWASQGFAAFIAKKFVTAPNTAIINRAPVLDDANTMKVLPPQERIMVRSISMLKGEMGPNNDPVWEIQNRDTRIRFVGYSWITDSSISGARASKQSGETTAFAEVTYYGSGLIMLMALGGSGYNITQSTDGGSTTTILSAATFSSVLASRAAATNQPVVITSGLTVGWHTTRINFDTSSFSVYGFDIVQARTDLNLVVAAGDSFAPVGKNSIPSALTAPIKKNYTSTKGGRTIVYSLNGAVGQAVTEVDSTPKYLTNADHTNEEVVRIIHPREFGGQLTTDFSTLTTSSSNRLFALEDGSFAAIGSNAAIASVNGYEVLDGVNANTDGFWIIFVGCGLDVTATMADTSIRDFAITVDGVSVGTSTTSGFLGSKKMKICSGLPFGTHIVRFTRTANGSHKVFEFIIYQPKKPTLPAGAQQLADYCVPADFVLQTAATGLRVSTGVIRKQILYREGVYRNGTTGTTDWTIGGYNANYDNGQTAVTNKLGASLSVTFTGVGFDFRTTVGSGYAGFSIAINGVAVNSSYPNAANIDVATYGGTNFGGMGAGVAGKLSSASTANLACAGTGNACAGFMLNGLPHGTYTVTFTNTGSSATVEVQSLDVITPMWSYKTNMIGQSLTDLRNFDPRSDKPGIINDFNPKAILVYDRANSKIKYSKNVKQVSTAGNQTTGDFSVHFEKPFKDEDSMAITYGTGNIGDVNADASGLSHVFINRNFVRLHAVQATTANNVNHCCVLVHGELEDENDIY